MTREALIAELCSSFQWSPEQIELGVRAGFKCEYCGRDLLASVDDYDAWQVDHVFPASRRGPEDPENKAVSCKTCNFMKRNWIPEGTTIDSARRDAMILEARRHIERKRAQKSASLSRMKELVAELMKLRESGG
jgi:hypothetical protein